MSKCFSWKEEDFTQLYQQQPNIHSYSTYMTINLHLPKTYSSQQTPKGNSKLGNQNKQQDVIRLKIPTNSTPHIHKYLMHKAIYYYYLNRKDSRALWKTACIVSFQVEIKNQSIKNHTLNSISQKFSKKMQTKMSKQMNKIECQPMKLSYEHWYNLHHARKQLPKNSHVYCLTYPSALLEKGLHCKKTTPRPKRPFDILRPIGVIDSRISQEIVQILAKSQRNGSYYLVAIYEQSQAKQQQQPFSQSFISSMAKIPPLQCYKSLNHPFLMPLCEYFRMPERDYYIMQWRRYCRFKDLFPKATLNSTPIVKLTIKQIHTYVLQLLSILLYLQTHYITPRSINSNTSVELGMIYIDEDGHIQLGVQVVVAAMRKPHDDPNCTNSINSLIQQYLLHLMNSSTDHPQQVLMNIQSMLTYLQNAPAKTSVKQLLGHASVQYMLTDRQLGVPMQSILDRLGDFSSLYSSISNNQLATWKYWQFKQIGMDAYYVDDGYNTKQMVEYQQYYLNQQTANQRILQKYGSIQKRSSNKLHNREQQQQEQQTDKQKMSRRGYKQGHHGMPQVGQIRKYENKKKRDHGLIDNISPYLAALNSKLYHDV